MSIEKDDWTLQTPPPYDVNYKNNSLLGSKLTG